VRIAHQHKRTDLPVRSSKPRIPASFVARTAESYSLANQLTFSAACQAVMAGGLPFVVNEKTPVRTIKDQCPPIFIPRRHGRYGRTLAG